MDLNADKYEMFCFKNTFLLSPDVSVPPPENCDMSLAPGGMADLQRADAELDDLLVQLKSARYTRNILQQRLQSVQDEQETLQALSSYLQDAMPASQRPAALEETVKFLVERARDVTNRTEELRQRRSDPAIDALFHN